MERRTLSRRALLRLAAVLPVGAILAACGDSADEIEEQGEELDAIREGRDEAAAAPALPTATPTPEPIIIAAGEQQRLLMAGTPHETALHVFGTGGAGPAVLVLGGVHGNEPGGWMAAERIMQEVRPAAGALLVMPRANTQAIAVFERTTDELGDLNRLYPGDAEGLPMERMAHEIVEVIREFGVSLLLDMHESWAFFSDRTENQRGTAFLGQTISSRGEPGESLARHLVEVMNSRIQAPHEEFFFREWPPRGFALPSVTPGGNETPTPEPGTTGSGPRFGGSRSSLGLPNHVDGLAAVLVEMGQQQSIERRVQLHVDVARTALARVGA